MGSDILYDAGSVGSVCVWLPGVGMFSGHEGALCAAKPLASVWNLTSPSTKEQVHSVYVGGTRARGNWGMEGGGEAPWRRRLESDERHLLFGHTL